MAEIKEVFQFTTSQGGRRKELHRARAIQIFQFTTSQGGRLRGGPGLMKKSKISIHDLTRRSTNLTGGRDSERDYFNSRPHKEVDLNATGKNLTGSTFQFTTSQGGRLERIRAAALRLTFQFTTSQGGRPGYSASQTAETYISIHDLTRRSTANIHNYCEYLYTLFSILYKPFLFTLFYF